jgi:hypothetical protein
MNLKNFLGLINNFTTVSLWIFQKKLELNDLGFEVKRKTASGQYKSVGFVNVKDTNTKIN